MSITNAARRFEQRFDAKAERFIWHHPLLGSISIFVGMPITGFGVCLYQYDRYRLSYGMAFWVGCNLYFIFKHTKDH